MEYEITKEQHQIILNLSGHFTLEDREEFIQVINDILSQPIEGLSIGMQKLEFIDSAGLGLLIYVYEKAKESSVALKLQNPCGQVKKLLQVSSFFKLFAIEE